MNIIIAENVRKINPMRERPNADSIYLAQALFRQVGRQIG